MKLGYFIILALVSKLNMFMLNLTLTTFLIIGTISNSCLIRKENLLMKKITVEEIKSSKEKKILLKDVKAILYLALKLE